MDRMPSLFVSHGGGPCFFMDWDPPDAWSGLGHALQTLSLQLPREPTVLVVISAHWEADCFTVTGAQSPSLIYDYYGFPEHTYRLRYPAAGAPATAQRITELLQDAGLEAAVDTSRGWDHGVFVPLMLAWPNADIPAVQLSLRADLDPAAHLACGRALAPLRDENVLIVGSGYSYHNLREFFGPQALDTSTRFDAWLQDTVCARRGADRADQLCSWSSAPAARRAHPREEHLLPLMVAAGAGGEDPGAAFFNAPAAGVLSSCFRFG